MPANLFGSRMLACLGVVLAVTSVTSLLPDGLDLFPEQARPDSQFWVTRPGLRGSFGPEGRRYLQVNLETDLSPTVVIGSSENSSAKLVIPS